MEALPAAEAVAGRTEDVENDVTRMSGHLDDVTDSGEGEVADLLRPMYLDYLRKHNVTPSG
jgi:hypothetical protein